MIKYPERSILKLNKDKFTSYYSYININGADLYTACCLPESGKKFPTVILRTPYIFEEEGITDADLAKKYISDYEYLVEAGYAVVLQHCRGCGKSSGDCVPYINERADGLSLHDWVRGQPFYNGELYLVGASYTSSVHYVTAPFADDIKGAVLEVQTTERYDCNYRNGFYKIGLHGCWYPTMYKKKDPNGNNYTLESFNILPLTDFSEAVFGEKIPSFDEIFLHPDRSDDFWNTHFGGGETRGVLNHANIPILLMTGFYDIYTGGIFDMWNALDEETKAKSALLVQPYDHGNDPSDEPIEFENGCTYKIFGNHILRWLEHVRLGDAPPIPLGKITYHKLFSGTWQTDDFSESGEYFTYRLGEGEHTYTYDPADPAYFKGGLSCNFCGCEWQDAPGTRQDIITFYTPEFDKDTAIKGKMKMKLTVKSDCEDTCFYVRLSLVKEAGDYGLRDDINQISAFAPAYVPGEKVEMSFSFDEHSFVIQKGEKIRIDVSSSCYPHYVRHTNNRGLFSVQTDTKIAKNTVIADKSEIVIPIE